MNNRVGIGISTTANRNVLQTTFPAWANFLPDDARIEVYPDNDWEGVATVKNRLLEILEDCEHIFLADDDVMPIKEGWHLPYINSGQKHLMYNFRLPNKPKTDMQEIHRDDKITAWTHTRGALLYIHRSVLDVVGGFDTRYNFDFFHPDFSNRVHNAGLTPYRSMDVPNSSELFYCLDQDGKIESSVPDKIRKANSAKDYRLYKENRQSKAYMEYK